MLVGRAREVVGEAAAGGEPTFGVQGCGFRGEARSGAHGRHVGTRGGEVWEELRRVPAVVGDALPIRADATVPAGEDEGDAARAELRELVADAVSVGGRDGLLVVAVRGAYCLGYLVGGLGKEVVYPVQVGLLWLVRHVVEMKSLVGIYLVQVGWSARVRSERGLASGAPGRHGRGIRHTKDVLRIQIAFLVLASLELCHIVGSLLVITAVDDFDREGVGRIDRIGAKPLQEQLDIGAIVRVAEVVGHAYLVLAGGLWRVVDGAVESAEALRRDALSIADGIDILRGLGRWRLTVGGP